ncbi:helix-turn-helix domain-containing protein [Asaia bogorensis]|uniref:helix-turn-helix domain-containing protein n=1 Tax=Asaia bogorensis TaxID=91915 RepID=UPI0028656E99|nr:helix-turn-helix transcriptional regulator [Asaia bogorensis]MDR6182083.1 transcriptional regulator with XRE-family HTH domain [Asaia bogorensis NBRC 16594]
MGGIYRRYDDEGKRRMLDGLSLCARHNTHMAHVKAPKSTDLKDAVRERLVAAVSAYGISQAELARRLGVSSQQVNGYIKGRNYPDELFIVKFCDLTGCTLDWLYRGLMSSVMPVELAVHIALENPELMQKGREDISQSLSLVSAES